MPEGCTTNCLTFFLFPTFSNIVAIVDNRPRFSTSNHYNSIKVSTLIGSNVVKAVSICIELNDMQSSARPRNSFQTAIQAALVTPTIEILFLR